MNEVLKTSLTEALHEEHKDYEKYKRLSEMAESEGLYEYAGVLRDIAHEEYNHHCYISEMLHD